LKAQMADLSAKLDALLANQQPEEGGEPPLTPPP
jgi:hypothetical protein